MKTIQARLLSVLISSLLFFLPLPALAAVQITQVMYDLPGSDAGREWIEITNKGDVAVDVSGFKLLEGGVKHKLTLSQGSWLLLPGSTAVVASDAATFLAEHTAFTQSVYKSSFSLANDGETIALINAKGEIEHTLTYTAPPPAPKPTPVVSKKTSPKSASSKSSSNQTASAAEAPKNTFVPHTVSSSADSHSLLPWYAGLVAIIGLGIAGVVYIKGGETKPLPSEFEILEN